MPPRPSLTQLSRTSYICQSCLASLNTVCPVRPQQPWQQVRHYAFVRRGARSRTEARGSPPGAAVRAEEIEKPRAPLAINYFNQQPSGQLKPVDNETYSETSGGIDQDLRDGIEELEVQMEAALQILDQMESSGQKTAADQLRERFGSLLQTEGDEKPVLDITKPIPQIASFETGTKSQKDRIAALNRFLQLHREHNGEVTPKLASFFWKIYVPARQTLALSWSRVPADAWKVFWAVGSWDGGNNPNRMHHIFILSQDMQAAGVSLDDSQRFLTMEATFLEGLQQNAIDMWKKAAGTLGAKPATFREYWETGVRMCSIHGDNHRALRAANTLLDSEHNSDPAILIPLIRAFAQDEATREQAWTTYRRLRELLGDKMEIEHFDKVIEGFLSTNSVELALQVFVDMMFSGAIDLHGKTKLPAQVANRFFLGKWLKRLIGAGDLDGAYKVVCYMADRGVLAAPIQLNGLLGAWARSGTVENTEKAEKLGWAMIRARLLFVDMRKHGRNMDGPVQLVATDKPKTDEEVQELSRVLPATLETFSVMADSYQKRRLPAKMEELWVAFKQSEIGTDSFMMNQMIQTYIQDGAAPKAHTFYHNMTRNHGILPDAFTFLALYQSLNINRLHKWAKVDQAPDVERARAIFQDMVAFPWGFSTPHVHEQLPRLVLLSLHGLKDYAGMIVAARAMTALFGFAPSEALLVELATGDTSMRRGRRPSKKAMSQLVQVSGFIDTLLAKQRRPGQTLETLSYEDRVAELGAVLEILVLRKAEADAPREQIEEALAEAARAMGAYEIAITRDPKAIAQGQKKIEYASE